MSPHPRREAVPADGRPHYLPSDVLTPEEMPVALGIGESTWEKRKGAFPVSYVLGERSPRYIWGRVLDVLRETEKAA